MRGKTKNLTLDPAKLSFRISFSPEPDSNRTSIRLSHPSKASAFDRQDAIRDIDAPEFRPGERPRAEMAEWMPKFEVALQQGYGSHEAIRSDVL
jgi:hypothetical protein